MCRSRPVQGTWHCLAVSAAVGGAAEEPAMLALDFIVSPAAVQQLPTVMSTLHPHMLWLNWVATAIAQRRQVVGDAMSVWCARSAIQYPGTAAVQPVPANYPVAAAGAATVMGARALLEGVQRLRDLRLGLLL